jgi:signal transduction histidine kinase
VNRLLGAIRRVGVRRMDAALDVTLLVVAELVVLNRAASAHLALPVAAVLGAGSTVPLLVRRRAPLVVLAITGGSLLALMALGSAPGVVALGPTAALYTVVTNCPRRVSLVSAAAGAVGLVAAGALGPAPHGWRLLAPVALLAAAWLASDNIRVRRAYVAELRVRAERAEADRQQEIARAAEQERLRIARELHDVIAHHVSVIAIQASGLRLHRRARTTTGVGDGDADAAVDAIERTSRQTLAELRRLLGVLRHGDVARSATLAPQPGMAALDDLVADVRAAGLPVTVTRQGQPVLLPAALDLSAYRLIQEALTNVLKHQGAVATDVVIRYGHDRLSISVRNAGGERTAADADRVGHGLIGMRERVAMFGGHLSAGPRPDRGYEVVAELPLAGAK